MGNVRENLVDVKLEHFGEHLDEAGHTRLVAGFLWQVKVHVCLQNMAKLLLAGYERGDMGFDVPEIITICRF